MEGEGEFIKIRNTQMSKKTLLLTGVSGSIGCHFLAHFMHNTEWDIVGISSFRHKGESDRINGMLDNHEDWKPRYRHFTHDLIGPFSERMKEKIGKIDYIINLASLSDVQASIEDPVTFIQNNVWSTLNMLEYAREAKPEVFLQFSTDEIFGPCEDGQRFKEWDPVVPSNPYSASKASQEAIAISYWRTFEVPLVITNTVNNFGEYQQASKFPVIVQKKVAKGEVVPIHGKEGEPGTRYYMHSRNAADAILFILKNTVPHKHVSNAVDKPDRYNITSDDRLSNLELAQEIAEAMGKELRYEYVDHHSTRPGHDRHYSLSGEKLKNLGWKQPHSFKESLKNTVEWQAKHNEWIK